MCGRFYIDDDLKEELDQLIHDLDEQKNGIRMVSTGEIHPDDPAVIMSLYQGSEKANLVKWGYQGIKNGTLLFNARQETIEEKKTFQSDFKYHRCLIPASGYYEWSHDKPKKKYYFTVKGQNVIYLAGIEGISGNERRFTILTTDANEVMSSVHHRMPVIIPEEKKEEWLYSYEGAKILKNQCKVDLTKEEVLKCEKIVKEPVYEQIHIFNTIK